MRRVFADTAYFVALARTRDQLHRQATYFHEHPPGPLLTTEWILTEVANRLADPPLREGFMRLLAQLRGRTDVEIVRVDHEHFQQGCELYGRRKDKDWSLTDCISFVIMREHGIDTALTSDEDFEQAGFQRLLDPGPRGVRETTAPPYATGSQDLAALDTASDFAASVSLAEAERPAAVDAGRFSAAALSSVATNNLRGSKRPVL